MVVTVFLLSLSPLFASQDLVDLLFLLLHQVGLHRVVVVVLGNQLRQLSLLGQQLPPLFLLLSSLVLAASTAAPGGRPLPPLHILPPDLALLGIFVVAQLVPRVVHAHHAAPDGCAPEVVDGQVGAALVLVLEPAEALGFPRLLVARQLEKRRLAELREDCYDIPLG